MVGLGMPATAPRNTAITSPPARFAEPTIVDGVNAVVPAGKMQLCDRHSVPVDAAEDSNCGTASVKPVEYAPATDGIVVAAVRSMPIAAMQSTSSAVAPHGSV